MMIPIICHDINNPVCYGLHKATRPTFHEF